MEKNDIVVYTDGSCNPTYKVGAWASIIFVGKEKIILKGIVANTTHQRMELQAIIETMEFLTAKKCNNNSIIFYTDSQYAVNLPHRRHKLEKQNFITKGNNVIRNDDLLRTLLRLLDSMNIVFSKVKAHQQKSYIENYNRDVDKLVRQMVRQKVLEVANVQN